MQVVWQKFIFELSGNVIQGIPPPAQFCPICKHSEPTLYIVNNPIQEELYFNCKNNTCNFAGSFLDLIAQTYKIDLIQAANLFKRGEKFNGTLLFPENETQVQTYIANLYNQLFIQEYLNHAHQYLLNSPEGDAARVQLKNILPGQIKNTPKNFGILIPPIPAGLKFLNKYLSNKKVYVIIPYTYNNRVTGISLRALDAPDMPIFESIFSDKGVIFEPDIPPTAEQLFFCSKEEDACLLRQRIQERHIELPAITTTNELPLPVTFKNIKEIILIGTNKHPVSLRHAILFYITNQLIDGVFTNPSVTVLTLQTSELNHIIFSKNEKKYIPSNCWYDFSRLSTYIVQTIHKYIENQQYEELNQAFDGIIIPENKKQKLIQAARTHFSGETLNKLVDFLNIFIAKQTENFILANKIICKFTNEGMIAILNKNKVKILSNAILKIPEIIISKDKQTIYNCDLYLPKTKNRYQISIPENAFQTHQKLQKAVRNELHKQKINEYVAFYNVPGCSWGDICSCLSATSPIKVEIDTFGADESGNIHFPNIIITPDKILNQNQAFTLLQQKQLQYKSLNYVADADLSVYKKLFEAGTHNQHLAGLVLGISHIILQILYTRAAKKENTEIIHRHLFFVEQESGVWEPVVRQLGEITNAPSSQLLKIPLGKRTANLSYLGGLPVVAQLQINPQKLTHDLLDNLETSVISFVNDNVAAELISHPCASFIITETAAPEMVLHLDEESVTQLKYAFPLLLKEAMAFIDKEKGNTFKLGKIAIPAHLGYSILANILNIPTSSYIENLACRYFTAGLAANVYEFFEKIHKHVCGKFNKTYLKVQYQDPTQDDLNSFSSNVHIFVGQQYVFIKKAIINLSKYKNKKTHYAYEIFTVFQPDMLTESMKKHQMLCTNVPGLIVDMTRWWVIPKEIWDKYVIKTEIIKQNEKIYPLNVVPFSLKTNFNNYFYSSSGLTTTSRQLP